MLQSTGLVTDYIMLMNCAVTSITSDLLQNNRFDVGSTQNMQSKIHHRPIGKDKQSIYVY